VKTFILAIVLFSTTSSWSQTVPQGTRFLVKLGDSLSSATSKKGDPVRAVVISPERLRGGRLEGAVAEVGRGRLRFSFHLLRFTGKEIPIRTEITGIVNSQGNSDRDDLEQSVTIEQGTVTVKGSTVVIDEGAEIRLVGGER